MPIPSSAPPSRFSADAMDPNRRIIEGHHGAEYCALMTEALHKILLEKQLLSLGDTDRVIAALEAPNITWGARIVAEAWRDEAYARRLVNDGSKSAAKLGFRIEEARLVVVRNQPLLHNVIVCTLYSCYPHSLLGQPPYWYIPKIFRARTAREPRAVLEEFGLSLPADVELRVHDANADMRYLVLPMAPEGAADRPLAELISLVTRHMLMGAAVV